jgi:hypothetical protein
MTTISFKIHYATFVTEHGFYQCAFSLDVGTTTNAVMNIVECEEKLEEMQDSINELLRMVPRSIVAENSKTCK